MPRFLTVIRIDENTPADDRDPGFDARMGALFEEITKAGVMLDTAALAPTAEGTRLTWSGGRMSVVDGPFTETKEVIGGYSIVQAKDKAEAVAWAERFLRVHSDDVSITAEVREIAEG
ncbi:YciI family protein [Streptomyces sp. SID3343]|uniref:YciI family protein n=1 Tax=Streptomyces sp. SID3343 TaxID=2690260 RepID=UPI00136E537A|nr:YciI family protein [Streptomyces sp. SID3343]MYW00537.1 transcriptional regulator [Streptomyces sp. SID3343]